MIRRFLYIDHFRGWRATFPRANHIGSGRAIRFGFYVTPEGQRTDGTRWWWRRHPIDTAVAGGFGTPLVSLTHYRMVATHLRLRVSRRVSLSVSALGRWAPRWWRHWMHRRWLRRKDSTPA